MKEDKNEILGQVSEALIAGNKDACIKAAQKALSVGLGAQCILLDGLKKGMDVVGNNYANHVFYLPNVLASADIMYEVLDVLKPHLMAVGEAKSNGTGTVIIGTVEGDLHDIGKNIVRIMLDGMAFNVIDLGRDVPLNHWIEKIGEIKPDVVGASTLMSATLRSIEDLMNALNEKGLRRDVKTIIGGAATNATFAERVGCDAWGEDANDGIKKIVDFCEGRRK